MNIVNLDIINKAKEYIINKINEHNKNVIDEHMKINIPKLGVILGSGLGNIADEVKNSLVIKYNEIPGFPTSSVAGHKGQFVIGNFMGKDTIMMQGRFHYYEGHPMRLLALPIYTMKSLGTEKLIVTNAAGGVNESFKPGTLMLIKDHINFSFNNPLIGENIDEFGPRFPDMTHTYTLKLRDLAKDIAKEIKLDVKEGVYLMCSGPTYETPAEIRAFRLLGADAVGMSTVPETIIASHCKMEVLGISCITNLAAGILDTPLDHKEVLEVSKRVNREFIEYLSKIIERI